MAKVAVVHTQPTHFDTELEIGKAYRVIEEPENILEIIIYASVAKKANDEDVVLLDLGESYAAMTVEPDEEGLSFGKFFFLEEV